MKKFLPKTLNNPQGFIQHRSGAGFTLIELMVVISIIAILSVIGVTIFTDVQKNARDTGRKGDIEAISKALEANYISGSATPYKVLTTAMFASGIVPTDPQTAANYSGLPAAAVASYMVCATLEKPTGNATTTAGANLGGKGPTYTFYCRKNAQ